MWRKVHPQYGLLSLLFLILCHTLGTSRSTMQLDIGYEHFLYMTAYHHSKEFVNVGHDCSDRARSNFICRTIKYPATPRVHDLQGTAIARFIIERDSCVSKIDVFKGICQEITNEVMRLIEGIPLCMTGMYYSEKRGVQYNLPNRFKR